MEFIIVNSLTLFFDELMNLSLIHIFSAARPWWVGIMYSNPVRRVMTSFSLKNEVAPA